MKKTTALLFAMCAIFCASAAYELPKEWKDFVNNRRVCVKRDTTTLAGHVITYWERNGKPDWILPAVVTNEVKVISGKRQNNPLQTRLEQAQSQIAEVRASLTEKIQAAENAKTALQQSLATATARADAAEARHERLMNWLEGQRDAAKLATTKAIWQSVIDKITQERDN